MIIVLVTTNEKSLGTDFNQENWMLVIRLMYTIFDFRKTKMCLMCLNLWFYGTYATSKGFRTHWTLIIGLQGHMGNFKKIKDYLKRTPWMRKKFNDLSDMFQIHVCRHGLRTPNESFFSNIPNILVDWADRRNKLWGILGCFGLLSVAFSKIITALKSQTTCYNLNINKFFTNLRNS